MTHDADCDCRLDDTDHAKDCFGCTCRCKCHITDFGPCDECASATQTIWYPGADSVDLDDLYSGRKDIGEPVHKPE